ncbi:MAG: enoyl-CoA hydratase-related protein [Bacteroidota bacterium]
MDQPPPVLYHFQDGIAHITFNRPSVFNSFNREMALATQAALDKASEDEQVRAIVLTGEGKAFCAGQDLKEVTDEEINPGFKVLLEEHYTPIVSRIRDIRKPILAAVNGVAAGAGANIALACDLVIAHEGASFIQAFSKIGLIPDSGGTFFLPRIIGFQRATALAMLGDKVSSSDAETMGMIYKAAPADEYEAMVMKTARKLAKMPTRALGLIKAAFNASMHNDLSEQLKLETELQIEASETEDYQEGVTAFIEKRKPSYKGK